MEWSEAVYNALQLFREEAPLEALQLETILPYWDVTNLNEAATEQYVSEAEQTLEEQSTTLTHESKNIQEKVQDKNKESAIGHLARSWSPIKDE